MFLINFAIGVVTGIVQEFQFGMNWSSYSRFVGDVFGAPLAMEALLAFFLESTFLGLWIFGWDKLSAKLHLTCMWLVSIGTMLSAFFIIAANSFMQNPVGITVNEDRLEGARAEMNDVWAVLTQPLNLAAYAHVLAASVLSGAALFAGVASYFLMKRREVSVFRPSVRIGLVGMLIGSLAVLVTGDMLAKVMTEVQPMKMAVRRGAVRHHRPARRSRWSPSAPWTAAARCGRCGCRACCPSWPPDRSTAPSRASTTSRPSSRTSTAQAITGRTSRWSTGCSG